MLKNKQQRTTHTINRPAFNPKKRGLPNDQEKTRIDFAWVSLFTLCITVFTAIAFGAGKAYRNSYLGHFGFVETTMPWSFQDVAYLGITKQLGILLAAPVVAIWTVFCYIFLREGLAWTQDRLAAKIAKKPINSQKTKSKSSTKYLLDASYFLLICFAWIFIVGWLGSLFVLRAEQLGGFDAKAAKESSTPDSKEKKKLPYVTIERSIGGKMITETGYLVSCSDRACGLHSQHEANGTSRLVPLDNVTLFQYNQ